MRQHLEVVIGGEVLEEVALGLHDAVELVNVDLAGAITVSLCDHVLHLLVIDVLSELLSHAGKVAEGDPGGVVAIEVGDHLLELLVLDLEAKGAHGSLELTHVNLAGCISIEKTECLTDLVKLLLGESSLLLVASHV